MQSSLALMSLIVAAAAAVGDRALLFSPSDESDDVSDDIAENIIELGSSSSSSSEASSPSCPRGLEIYADLDLDTTSDKTGYYRLHSKKHLENSVWVTSERQAKKTGYNFVFVCIVAKKTGYNYYWVLGKHVQKFCPNNGWYVHSAKMSAKPKPGSFPTFAEGKFPSSAAWKEFFPIPSVKCASVLEGCNRVYVKTEGNHPAGARGVYHMDPNGDKGTQHGNMVPGYPAYTADHLHDYKQYYLQQCKELDDHPNHRNWYVWTISLHGCKDHDGILHSPWTKAPEAYPPKIFTRAVKSKNECKGGHHCWENVQAELSCLD